VGFFLGIMIHLMINGCLPFNYWNQHHKAHNCISFVSSTCRAITVSHKVDKHFVRTMLCFQVYVTHHKCRNINLFLQINLPNAIYKVGNQVIISLWHIESCKFLLDLIYINKCMHIRCKLHNKIEIFHTALYLLI